MDKIFIVYSLGIDHSDRDRVVSYHKTLDGAISVVPENYLKYERTTKTDYGRVRDYTYYAIKEVELLN